MSTFSPDSIPDVAEVREGLVHRLEKNRVAILVTLSVLVVGSVALLAVSSVKKERVETLQTRLHSITDDFRGDRSLITQQGNELVANRAAAEEQAKKLEELRKDASGTEVEPQVLLHLAICYQILEQDDRVLSTIDELRSSFPTSPVLQIQSFDSDRTSLADRIASISRKRKEFASQRKVVEPKADPAVSALVETDLGKLRILFYRDLAPKHAEAFMEQAKKGGFNGTRLYYARRGEWVELGGGSRTRNAEPRDDREDDPDLAIAPEDEARFGVRHRRRMVTSVPLLSGDQADRFAIILSEKRPEFDSSRTPFGELLDDESAAVADRLGNALTYSEDASYLNRREKTDFPFTPSQPVTIRRVSIWREGALMEGHTWDTSRVNSDQPEPEPPTEGAK